MKNLEKFARDFLVSEHDNVITYLHISNCEFYYYSDDEIWELPRSLERILDDECVDYSGASIEWIEG